MALAEREVMEDMQQEEEAVETGAVLAPAAVPAEKSERGKRGRKPAAAVAPDPAPAPQPVPPVAAPVPASARRKFRIPTYVYWLFLAVALLIGGFWLVQNSWVISNNIDHPYALLAGPALVVSILALWLIIKFFTAIERGVKSAVSAFKAARAKDEAAQFFWIVIAVFLAVSVFASGDFFSKLEKEAIPGLGYATALFIDLVAVQCMRARLNAGRLRDKRGQALYLAGVVMCASASAFANVYTTLTTFNTATSGLLPQWMADFAPWFGLVFPALIVLLSMTADYTLDQASSKLDPESYKKEEGKRVKLLEYQRDLLRERVKFEHEIDDLAAQLRGRKEKRMFFLIAWLFPVQMSGKQLLKRVEELYQPQMTALKEQNEALLQQGETLRGSLVVLERSALGAYGNLFQSVQILQASIDGQRDTDNRLLVERIDGLAGVLRQELASVTVVEELRQGVRELVPAVQVEELAGVLRQEMAGLAPTSWVEDLSQRMNMLVSASEINGLTSTLRQEMRGLTTAKVKLNYTELARALAPLLAKQGGLREVNSVVNGEVADEGSEQAGGDTGEMQALNLETLASFNGAEETSLIGSEVELRDADREALLEQSTVSIREAAAIIGCEPKYVRTLRDRRTLKATPRNKDLITTASLKAYLVEREARAS